MTHRKYWYVGIMKQSRKYVAFSQSGTPTDQERPQFSAVIGPFRTRRGVLYMAEYGKGNPIMQHVDDAEELAKIESEANMAK